MFPRHQICMYLGFLLFLEHCWTSSFFLKIGHFVMYLSIFLKSLKTDTPVGICCSWLADFCWYMLSPFLNHMEYFLCIFKGNYFEPWTVSFLELRNFISISWFSFDPYNSQWCELNKIWTYKVLIISVKQSVYIHYSLVCFVSFFNSTDVFSDFSRGDSLQSRNTKSHCG